MPMAPMSQRSIILGEIDTLDVIKEERSRHSSVNINDVLSVAAVGGIKCEECDCKAPVPDKIPSQQNVINVDAVEDLFQERVAETQKQFEHAMEKQINALKERFDFILQNEQVRTSCMMREAHRERQEKILALQSQLECKNLAGLMYVMCSERRRGKLEKLRIIEEYTGYIRGLQDMLTEAQELILNLSRGYKTAARVDHEWRTKMQKIIKEFQAYVVNYNGGTPETNQYIFDLPRLLQTKAPVTDNPQEDPCDGDDSEEGAFVGPVPQEAPWYEQLEGDCRPFVMFGDMADFTAPQRRETLRVVKATKTAPRKWKKYVFNDMYLRRDCSHLDFIKHEHEKRFPMPGTWECHAVQTVDPAINTPGREESITRSRYDFSLQRLTSVDARAMGSILKIISVGQREAQEPVTKANLLGARDSMEIKSTTIVKEKTYTRRPSVGIKENTGVDKFEVGHRNYEDIDLGTIESATEPMQAVSTEKSEVDDENETQEAMGSINDSLQIMVSHKPEPDHKINYEKVCPMKKCRRMQVDSFTRQLPSYMRASPYLHFEQTFDNYEPCTPEQLEFLKAKVDSKKSKRRIVVGTTQEELLEDWASDIGGVSCQTSQTQMYLPPCTCERPESSSASSESAGAMFKIEDLLPLKKTMNEIQEKCFFNENIEFNRFKVIGEESDPDIPITQEAFDKKRFIEIKRILKKHPSLCELFQAHTT